MLGAGRWSASPDGNTIVYTSSQTKTIGFADITNAKAPVLLGTLDLGAVTGGDGEPTSVAFSPNGEFVVVAVKDTGAPLDPDAGALVVVDAAARTVVGQVALGVGPDSVTLTPDGTRAIVAVEDEENESGNNAAQSRPGSIQVVTIDYVAPASSTVATISVNASIGNMPTDPQPEYIDVTSDGTRAIVSIQENNLVAIVDLESNTITDYIDLGTSVHARADLSTNGTWELDDAFEGQLQPDGVCLLSDDEHFITANEGDTGNGVFPTGAAKHAGGRGFSIFRTDGTRVYDSGDAAEWASYEHGAYPDGRSGNRGIEPEGCGAGTFGGREFAFVTGERNNTLFVVDVANPAHARIHQVLGAPSRPESVATIESRGLVLVGGEGDGNIEGGGIWIYESVDDAADLGHGANVYTSRANDATFSALSGLAHDAQTNLILGVPDNVFAQPRIFRFSVDDAARRVELVDEILLVNRAGAALTGMDSEGIVVNPEGGYIVATEGTGGNGVGAAACQGTIASNRVYFFDRTGMLDPHYGGDGIVDLPCGAEPNAFNWANMTANGFEGVTVVDEDPTAAGGLVVYVGFQRPLTGETRNRIGAYDVDTATWSFYYYQLDPDALPLGGAAGSTFISELIYVGGDQFAVIERDQGQAGTALNKTIRTFTLSSGTGNSPSDPVDKQTAVDLLAHPFRFDQEKLEGLALVNGALFVVNDNDGGIGHSFFLRLSESALGGVPEIVPDVVLSEINTSAAPGDWVELQNRGTAPVNVAGWTLRNAAGTVHTIGSGAVIPPGGYLQVSGLAFDLGSTDSVALGTLLGNMVDSHSWTAHLGSASRCGTTGLAFWPTTGAASATPSGEPTPGAANDCTGPVVEGQASIVINEVRSQGNDFVELYNVGASPVDIGNWKLTDNDPTHVFVVPAGTTVPAGGFVVIEGDWTSGPLALAFGLGSADSAILYSPYEQAVDTHSWTAHQNTGSRCPDGGTFAATNRTATSGAANSCL